VTITAGRTYGGQSAADRAADRRTRLIETGLELMGADEPLSVRKVIERSGLAPRYFYDHFPDIDALQVAVFDSLIAEAEQRGLAVVATGPKRPRDRIRLVLADMVALMLDDPRKGHVLLIGSLGSEALRVRRAEELRRFAGLLVANSPGSWAGQAPDAQHVRTTALFAMGGFAETVAAALQGDADVDREQLVDDLTELFLGTAWALRRMVR